MSHVKACAQMTKLGEVPDVSSEARAFYDEHTRSASISSVKVHRPRA